MLSFVSLKGKNMPAEEKEEFVLAYTDGMPHYGSRPKVAVPWNCTQELSGYFFTPLVAWDFEDGEKGNGCPHCCKTGRIYIYQRDDTEPYLIGQRCPYC